MKISAAYAALFSAFLVLAAPSAPAATGSVALAWDANPEQNIAGYHVHFGPVSKPYSQVTDTKTNSITLPNLTTGTTYLFAVSAYNTSGVESGYSQPVAYTPTLTNTTQMVTLDNISSRVYVTSGDDVMIGGFIVQSPTPKTVILRCLGPSLAKEGVTGVLADPLLELHDSTGKIIATNDNWNTVNSDLLNDLSLLPSDTHEAAMVATLPAGSYSVIIRGKGSQSGVALFELYNLDRTQGSLPNISTRGLVQTNDRVMIGGFIIGGSTPTPVIVRAVGPSLTAQHVQDALADPTLDLFNGDGDLLASNDDWRSNQQAAIIATTLPPSDDKEAAIVATLPPGAYSGIVRGKNNSVGVALFEVYALNQQN